MSEISANVLAAVERALKKDPSLSSKELQEQATKVDQSVAELTGRQFHARYALQAKRKLGAPAAKASKKRAAKKKATRKAAAKKTASRGAARKSATRKSATRKSAAKKSSTRKRSAAKGARRSTAPKKPQATLGTNDPVRALLREQFEERRASLDGALDAAFRAAIEADSLAKINDLLASLDRQADELRSN